MTDSPYRVVTKEVSKETAEEIRDHLQEASGLRDEAVQLERLEP